MAPSGLYAPVNFSEFDSFEDTADSCLDASFDPFGARLLQNWQELPSVIRSQVPPASQRRQ